ncbi:p23 chaperone protein wos2 [Recurvomyces mirabilis]|uniref:P23 chaperone protein wos2 n=1 Tax=Recurvomyces mirabilis TaxID=574656 RepID=A0AAE1C4P1_9PEZI|nr:p23 chaperone protein wos2 [Recurvomyces mirabilis]KAK5160660.1 p23 chaperone protein wos2 [Recurvomyces mirabilis]
MEVPKTSDTAKQGKSITPEVTWAQRSSASDAEKNHCFLTISVPDVDPKKITLDLKPDSLTFKGYSNSKKAEYALELTFFKEIDPSKSKINHTPRDVELVLQKKELGEEYWPRLLKDKAKVHFLKTDFDKWVDEDEQDAVGEDDDYMSKMGGMGGAGGMGGDGGFGGIDFSKLGGGAGMGGMPGMGGMGDMDEDDDDAEEDEDDDEMPPLEGEGDAAEGAATSAGSSGKAKIEEVE